MAPWHGGAASLTTEFIRQNPAEAKKYMAAYLRGVELVRKKPGRGAALPERLHRDRGRADRGSADSDYMYYNEFKPSDVAHFQKFYDLFSDKGIFQKRVMVDALLYKEG